LRARRSKTLQRNLWQLLYSLFLSAADVFNLMPQRVLKARSESLARHAGDKVDGTRSINGFRKTSFWGNAELRRARWNQVEFMKAEFRVGKAKTEGSEGRIISLNHAALGAFKGWKSRWPDAKPED
jgi:hypothetical protein